ncbi:sigma-E factor regulatory protein RseB domain-containing protein [Micromonospora sp. WMMA1363]|uniref:LolA family protein n=1 Tax=Micromonospora sp. WMMA1363 TaxID=3053985 RepID=UPI00259CA3A5|nr:sigma-E factor regulatory protein RseB domain-containing protein [Micromonospora sp. WMMA1363]MDM4718225.1 sigma-E factor regulatory protein RseB domain-containing protein [Micromonospora sp. WMMA1363]
MSVLTSRPALRWLVPVTAVVIVVGGGAAIGRFAAQAEPSLPPRTVAQLLVDLQTARHDGFSGTVVQRAELGLPPIAGLVAGDGPADLLTGTHTLRVWHSGPDRQRVALVDTLGERDIVRNGRDLWTWRSGTNTATHRTLPEQRGHDAPPEVPATPQEAADAALKAIDPTTEVSVGRAATVAGRNAYELVLTPRDAASLVHQVRIAIDATEHLPLRFEVFADGGDRPAFEVAFTQVDYARPDADQFTFNPPPGVKITEEGAGRARPETLEKPADGERPDVRTVGEGWTTVVVVRVDDAARSDASADRPDLGGLAGQLPAVSGDWGSGRLFRSDLVTALLTDDGRLIAGAVTPERLYEVAQD